MASITSQEFKTLARYIYSIAGIYLDDSKGYLIESRLNPLLVAFQLSSFSELYYRAKSDASGELEKHIIDAISTNETFFFRDTAPFDLLKFKILPELIDAKKVHKPAGKTPISIWSAACSTGQEVYSIAMSLIEVLPNNSTYEISIFGSDISQQAITQASYGQYNKLEVSRGLPPDYLQKYFQASDGGWRVKDFIRSMASFKVMNLMHPFGAIGPFDIVFCRNVAIYFSLADKKKLFARIARTMRPNGYLIIGGSETLSGLAPQFAGRHYLRGMYYQLQGSNKPAPAREEVSPPSREQAAAPKDQPVFAPQAPEKPKPAPPRTNSGTEGKERRGPDRTKPDPSPAEPKKTAPASGSPSATFVSPPQQEAKGKKTSLLTSLQDKHGRAREVKAGAVPKKGGTNRSLLTRLSTQKKKKKPS
ncbi:MAG: CheR family methyltransferase [Desulfovermiculus sp.]